MARKGAPTSTQEHLDGGLARFLDTWGGLAICAVLYFHAKLTGRRLPPMHATTPPDATVAPIAKPQRILTIKTYGLGNIAILMPVLACVRRAYPDAIIDLLRNPRRLVELGTRAGEWVEKSFALEPMVDRTLEFYEHCLQLPEERMESV